MPNIVRLDRCTFFHCMSLEEVIAPKLLHVPNGCFHSCNLHVFRGDSVLSCGSNVFAGELGTICLPNCKQIKCNTFSSSRYNDFIMFINYLNLGGKIFDNKDSYRLLTKQIQYLHSVLKKNNNVGIEVPYIKVDDIDAEKYSECLFPSNLSLCERNGLYDCRNRFEIIK